jgi:hypothetical protein
LVKHPVELNAAVIPVATLSGGPGDHPRVVPPSVPFETTGKQ